MTVERDLIEIAVLSLGIAILATLIWFLHYNGAFLPIKARKRTIGPVTVAYMTHVGPYDKVGPLFAQIMAIGKTRGVAEKPPGSSEKDEIRAGETMGVYFDDPKTTPKEELRAMVGVVLDAGKDVREERRKTWETKLRDIPEIEAVEILRQAQSFVIDFPMYGMFSILLGVKRAYPKLCKAMKQEFEETDQMRSSLPYGSIEFYSCEKHRALYCAPLEHRNTLVAFDHKKTQ